MNILSRMFTRRWLLATLLVVVGVGINIRLGIWQLDRLEQRQAFNTRVQAQVDSPLLVLEGDALQADLGGMEYRQVLVQGEYDFSQEVALRNQVSVDNRLGVHLLTPLKISGTQRYILVDRGWIPMEDFNTGDWSAYAEMGSVAVRGVLRAGQSAPDFGQRSDELPGPGEPPLKAWNFANVAAIDLQTPYDLLPAYVQQAPDPTRTSLPARSQPKLELTEGPHLGYAIQWFTFATLLGVGYPFFIRRQEARRALLSTASARA